MSSRFTKLYNALPPEAQHLVVEKHLAGLLDVVPKEKTKKVMAATTRLHAKYNKAPKLDLPTKKKQISDLLDDLARDAKTSIVPERSNRDELLSEIVHDLVTWLNTIWSAVYEYNVQFATAHACLLFVADALTQLAERSILGGCKCAVINLPVSFHLKDKNGKVLKRFSLMGPEKIDQILLWIWRDLFVSLFATGSERDKAKVPDFLEEIQNILGLSAMERLLTGGQPSDDDEDDDDNDWEDDEDEDEDEDEDDDDEDYDRDDFYDDENSDRESDGSDSHCPCKFHASYWTDKVNSERTPLRDHVEKRLLFIFEQAPSFRLFSALTSVSTTPHRTRGEAYKILQEIAGDTPENLAAALDIYVANNNSGKVMYLLDKYTHLLRARDMMTLQCAVALLAESPSYRSRSLSILGAELEDSFQAICVSVRTSFPYIEEEAHKKDLAEILKLKASSHQRKSRIETWVEHVGSTSNHSMGPMAFAAIMMGLPVLPGAEEGDDSDILNYVDLDQNDPDFDDLREEYRPDLKNRFEGWVHLGQTFGPSGVVVLQKLYIKAVEMMPYIRSQDVVNEMISKLRQRGPNKGHVLEALSNLSTFAKTQRKKISFALAEKKKAAAAAATAAAASQGGSNQAKVNNNNNSGSSGNSSSTTTTATRVRNNSAAARTPAASSSSRGPKLLAKLAGGMEDVD